jgi:hypothetical protein
LSKRASCDPKRIILWSSVEIENARGLFGRDRARRSGSPTSSSFGSRRRRNRLSIATVLVDSVSAPYLAGAEIDFVDDLIGAALKINNPNATASCGCGTSFSI